MPKINFVLGRAHSGKSACIYNEYISKTQDFSSEKYVFLVPDQMTLAVQKEILKLKKNKTLYNTAVIGFTRMAYRLYDEKNIKLPTVLDEIGKLLLIQKAMQKLERKESLTVFRGNAGRNGFIKALSVFLKEMTEFCITDDVALSAVASLEGKKTLAGKVTDILAIRKEYEELKAGTYVTSEDILSGAYELVENSRLFSGAHVYIDGFSVFTPIQYRIIEKIIAAASEVTFVLDMDEETLLKPLSDLSIFYESRKTYEKLLNITDRLGIVAEKPVFCKETHYPLAPSIAHMEAHYEQKHEAYTANPQEITLTVCHDYSAEIDYVLEKITELTSKGLHYRDIAVITTNPDAYAEIIEEKFARVKVPYFTDHKKSLFSNIGVEGLLAAVAICDQDFSYESTFRYLKSGLFSQGQESDKLDIYVRAMGIKHNSAYKKPFADRKKCPDRFTAEDITALDEYKDSVLASVLNLQKGLRSESIRSKIEAVKTWISETGVYEILENKKNELLENNPILAWQYGQTPELIDRILTQIGEILGDETADNNEFYKLLEMGFETLGVGIIPNSIDNVTIGDIKRSRLTGVKVLFVIGMNDKVFPAKVPDTGILSDADRELLLKNSSGALEMEETRKVQSIAMKYFVYRCLAKPSEHLYLSYSQTGEDQKSQFPSYVCGQIKRLFPELKELKDTKKIYHSRQGLLAVADPEDFNLDEDEVALKEYYGSSEEYSADYRKIQSAWNVKEKVAEVIDEERAVALFAEITGNNKKPASSISKLETFAACKLRHFLQHGLEAAERQEYEIRAFDIGTIYHDTLDKIFKDAKNEKKLLTLSISDDDLKQMVYSAMEEVISKFRFDFEAAGTRNAAMLDQMKEVLFINMKVIISQLAAGSMKPLATEVSFGMKSDDKSFSYASYDILESPFVLRGRIDRADTGILNDSEVLRIIDYKSGSASFDSKKIAAGLQLQLLVYMSAMAESEKKRIKGEPVLGGAYYYHIADEICKLQKKDLVNKDGSRKTDDEIKALIWEKTVKRQRLNGISAKETEILSVMESDIGRREPKTSFTSKVIDGYKITKDDVLSASRVVPEEMLKDILLYAQDEVVALGQGIIKGEAEANPYEYGQYNECMYCPYSGKCGFDVSVYSRFRKLTEDLPFGDEVSFGGTQEEEEE